MESIEEKVKDNFIFWGLGWQIILILIASISIDGVASSLSLVVSSICYWIIFFRIKRKKSTERTLVDRLFIMVGFFVLFFFCWFFVSFI
jgi:O-antigen/teichoic acid export membrane protein